MTDKETRGLFQGETTSFSLGDVQHFEKHWFVGDDRARVPYRGIQIITCHTKWNFEHDIWENNIYLSRDEAEKFIKQWSDEHECPPITDIPASVTKPVGTGSGTKAVTMTPDEYRHWRTI